MKHQGGEGGATYTEDKKNEGKCHGFFHANNLSNCYTDHPIRQRKYLCVCLGMQ